MQSVANTWENWKERSLLLHGTTRLGKTRAAFEVARRHWKANFKKQTFLTMRKLEQLIEQGYGKFDHSSRIQSLIDVPFLFIDDLGKEKMTARIATDLFAIIDERTIHHRTTVITTNFTSGSLIERFDDKELGLALIGRFKDYFDLVGATAKEIENNS
jgi:DNA replication protein DnaC